MAEEAEEITTKYCSTCKEDVPAANFEMHAIHCQRFLTRCPHCKESVNKNYLDEHIEEDHSQINCDVCGESVEKIELESHKETSCKSRSLKCEYCEISLPASDMDEHRESCGSRTEECEKCKRRILVKNLELHMTSGCQPLDTGTKTNYEKAVETKVKKPESLFYDNPPTQKTRITFNHDGKGFSISPQFLDSRYTLDRNERKHSDFRNGRFSEVDPEQASMESTTLSPVLRNLMPTKSFHEGEHGKENPKRYDNGSRKSFNTDHNVLPEYGIPDSDSDDDDDDGTNEKKPFCDLADDTLLPCEFCNEELPADSLAFHQATCDEMPPTPRVRPQPRVFSDPGFPDPGFSDPGFSDPGFSDSGFSDHPTLVHQSVVREKYALHTSQLQQASATTISSKNPDMGQCLAPCEFCDKLCSLNDLALHQITCAKNPNLEYFESGSPSERHPTHSPPPSRKTPPPSRKTPPPSPPSRKTPPPSPPSRKTSPPETTTNPSASLSVPQAKPIQPKDSDRIPPPRQMIPPPRQMRALAPTFSEQRRTPPQLKSFAAARPNAESHPVDNGDAKRDTQKPTRSGKFANGRPPAKNSPTMDRTFHEVNVLGSDQPKVLPTSSRISNGKKPYGTQSGDSNGDPLGGDGLFLEGSGFGKGGRPAGGGIGRGNRFTGSDHFRGTTQSRNPQGNKRSETGGYGRGRANLAARKYRARGGQVAGRQSRGRSTVTVQARAPRNPYSGDQQKDRDDGLTYEDLGLDAPLERTNLRPPGPEVRNLGRGRGRKLGSGKGGSRGGKHRNPVRGKK